MTEVQARGAHMSQSAEQAARKFLCNLPGAGRAYGAGRIVYESEVAALLTAREAALLSQVATLREALDKSYNGPEADLPRTVERLLHNTAEAAARRDEAIRASERERVTRTFAEGIADAFEKDGKTYSADCIRRALRGEPPLFLAVANAIAALTPDPEVKP